MRCRYKATRLQIQAQISPRNQDANSSIDSTKNQIGGGQNKYSKNANLNSTHLIKIPLILAQNKSNSTANQAQDSTDSPQTQRILTQTYDLGRIERIVKSDADSNQSVATITAQDFENTASSNVAEALRFTQGVYFGVPSGSKAGADIKIRGFGGDRVGIFIDGIPTRTQSMIDTQITGFLILMD